ncbi:SRPBCC family protein [Amycolatopsis sp. FDAARGOS 1241]|uniref:SRPBCC family protein n=1 Tax=Amycolatopsis sp. FDAARGOS 1241 TaxID=2778070 RepID=UPI00194E6A57|nr:SRPBCC family protein [Amycolatopsis sp. FDAARGOS 1241]QRP45690.1 SRPBCC family protein [Amycolatopsis sp. FDAARGOS 1241]
MPGRRYSFEVNRVSTAPPETLFRLETEGPLWSTWGRPLIVQARWARRGDDNPSGVGAVREVGLWPVLLRERTVEYELDRRHVYTFAGSGLVRDYRAEVFFTPNAAGGTDLRWTGSFTEFVPGTGPLALAALRTAIRFLSAQLVKAADTGR